MGIRGLAPVVVLAAFAAVGRPEDQPPDAAKPAASWPDGVIGHLAVSRDGAWLAGRARAGFQLFPVGGGTPVTLTFPKDEQPGFRCEFTADSKWLVVPGEASSIEAQGIPKDRTQAVYFFSVATPSKRKAIQINLKAEGLDKEVKKHMESQYRNMKTLKGAVMAVAALTGSRVLLDRGSVGVELWDAASATKSAPPTAIDGPYFCGIAADGSQFVVSDGPVLEVRDVKTNRVTATIRSSEDGKVRGFVTSHPRLASGGSDVVATCTTLDAMSAAEASEYTLRCWSVADGKKRWETPLGAAKYVSRVEVAGQFVMADLAGTVYLVDVADGSLPAHEFQRKAVGAAAPSADGKGLWVSDKSGLRRVELPEVGAK